MVAENSYLEVCFRSTARSVDACRNLLGVSLKKCLRAKIRFWNAGFIPMGDEDESQAIQPVTTRNA